ncbi:MAG: 4-hydroxybenzoate octaprenyltransferase [Proteobacteria bacterium]|nr:4-hydroxybenzoate octaprenyltransferase [Pseudomonadota bacterium]
MIQKQPENKKKESDYSDIPFAKLSKVPSFWKTQILLMRLDRPVGIFLPLFSAFLGLFGAAFPYFPKINEIILFSFGALIMRGAACILNDICDRNLDAKVKRTHLRPLASKKASLFSAFFLLLFLLTCGLGILIQFNLRTIFLGVILVFLSALYPLMKRLTYWPQVFLGVTFNAGVLMGWTAQGKDLNLTCFILYVATVLWTIGYDTIYAFQDIEDDIHVGVKSSALKVKDYARVFVFSIYMGSFGLFYWFGERMNFNALYKTACFIVGILFLRQSITLDIKNASACLKKFKSNVWIGFILFLGLVLSALIR